VTLEPFPTGWQARCHVATPEPSRTGRRVWSRGTHGNAGALPCQVACPVPDATGHVAMPELSDTGSWSGATGTRDDSRALLYWLRSLTQ
jgi:hypothetical protein